MAKEATLGGPEDFTSSAPTLPGGGALPSFDAVPDLQRYYGLARSLAHRYSGRAEPVEDLEQVALLALVKAARRYRPEHPAGFASFATVSILGELKRYFRDQTWAMRVPRSIQERYLAVKAAQQELSNELGASPTVSEIASFLGASEEDVLVAMEAGDNYRPRSLDAGSGEDGDQGIDVGIIDGNFDRSIELRELRDSLARLEPSEASLVVRLFFEGCTQRTLAEQIGMSQMQVSRMLARCLAKLRHYMEPE